MRRLAFVLWTFHAVAALAACGSVSRETSSPPTDAGKDSGTADVDADADAARPGSCVIPAPTPRDWRLHADGQLLRDALGRVVFLRGVGAGSRSKFAPYVPFDFATTSYASALGAFMDRAQSWGIDVLRLPYTWAALEPVQGQIDITWLYRYQELVQAAWAHGMWVVVDFHQDVYSESFCGDGFPSWTIANAPAPAHDCPEWSLAYFQSAAVQQAFDAFWAAGSTVMPEYIAAWDTMIATFKDEPGVVAFEPINEPAPGTADQATFEATTLTAFYTQMVAHMRAAAPQTLVFVEGAPLDGATLSTSLMRPTGDGVVYAPHFYYLQATPSTLVTDLQKWTAIGASWNVPVFLGEFGQSHDMTGVVDYATAMFGAFDALGMSGAEWEYSQSAEEWNSESYEVVAADGTEYPVAQALIRPFARAVAGSSISQSWDATALTFTLSYVPTAGGTTEVQLPSRAFPQGFKVTVSDGCYDSSSMAGRLLVHAMAGAAMVTVTVTAK
jgi:endoglycosylceramidase